MFQHATEQPDQLYWQQYLYRSELRPSAVTVWQQDLQHRPGIILHPALPVHHVRHIRHNFFSFLSLIFLFCFFISIPSFIPSLNLCHYLFVSVFQSHCLFVFASFFMPLTIFLYPLIFHSLAVGVVFQATHTPHIPAPTFAHMLFSGHYSPHRCSPSLSTRLVWIPGHLLSKLNIFQHLHAHTNIGTHKSNCKLAVIFPKIHTCYDKTWILESLYLFIRLSAWCMFLFFFQACFNLCDADWC